MEIEDLRRKIDSIDKAILTLLNERMELAIKIGETKRTEGGPVYLPVREETLIQKLLEANKGPMGESQIRSIFREIISAGISLQRKMLIGFLENESACAHQAAVKNFGSSLDYKGFKSIKDVFAAAERREIDFGVVPVEHSTEGTIFETLDCLSSGALKIVSQVVMAPILEACIQNIKKGMTRFFVIGQSSQAPCADVSWKTTLCLTLPNTLGSLQKRLLSFASRGIDLTKIESRPSRQRRWDYVFYLDVLGHWEDPIIVEAIQELETQGASVQWLGSYPLLKSAE